MDDGALTLLGFGPEGWGAVLLRAALTTAILSVCAFAIGAVLGTLCAWAKLGGAKPIRWLAEGYTTVMRGVPDLLVIYLFYFGGRQAVSALAQFFGMGPGGVEVNGFLAGALAIGLISGAGQGEVLRGAYHAIPKGEIEAGRVAGMGRWLLFRRVIFPQGLRTALPALGNQWQNVIKESALVSVTGVVETLRQISVAADSTQLPFLFYAVGAGIYLAITTGSGLVFRAAEWWTMRGQPAARSH
ncbi:ABC transporter permease [Roseomonas elaeocarpi]|uniref:ABC transporter permease n=1 Tax=Roseomonas elaeocarpi TaxID=907779 RepID=A0ABV6JNS8_9PROT